MNFATFSLSKQIIIWSLLVVFFVGGLIAYTQLARYEDPEFTIKEAMVIVPVLYAVFFRVAAAK